MKRIGQIGGLSPEPPRSRNRGRAEQNAWWARGRFAETSPIGNVGIPLTRFHST